MTTRGVADIVFCLDASGSMEPCFDGVRRHLIDFIEGLESSGQMSWDLRFDFVAHRCGEAAAGGRLFDMRSLYQENLWEALYGSTSPSDRLFSTSIDELRDGLGRVEVEGNEAPLVALDFALDFPWRQAAHCHRVVIQMTDEPFETGSSNEDHTMVPELISKMQELHVMLFLVGPDSEVFSSLSEADRCEYWAVDQTGDGLAHVDFREVLNYIGKSVSVSSLQQVGSCRVTRGLFGQPDWGRGSGTFSE